MQNPVNPAMMPGQLQPQQQSQQQQQQRVPTPTNLMQQPPLPPQPRPVPAPAVIPNQVQQTNPLQSINYPPPQQQPLVQAPYQVVTSSGSDWDSGI